ncbi:hypothetical protein [Halorubrum sp. N11]|uniref:hypothetical protein n=1 Tax=Halorubrum sp. N11 TaxID=3402276 RepID=UPI003EC0F42C
MTQLTRRTAIHGIGTGGVLALAGCTDDGEDGVDSGSAVTDTAVYQVGGALTGPAWDRESRRGFCTLVTDKAESRWLFDDAPVGTGEFVEATDFSSSVLVYVESVGPTTCYNRIDFADVSIEDGTLTASATVENTAAADEACGEAITYSAALLRVTADPLPDTLRLSVTNGWGETAELTGEEDVRDPDELAGFVRPDDDPQTVPVSLDCEGDDFEGDDFERRPSAYSNGVSFKALLNPSTSE